MHYLGSVAAVILILLASWGAYLSATEYDTWGQVVLVLIWALGIYAVSRGLRYILAGE